MKGRREGGGGEVGKKCRWSKRGRQEERKRWKKLR